MIDGIETAFYSGPVAPTLPSGATRVMRPGVLRMTAVRSSLDVRGAVVRPSEATITLAIEAPDGVDHVAQLLRLSPNGATRFLTLATTLPQSTATGGTITTNESNAGWPSAGYLWIGQECIAYSAKPTSTTFTISERGAFDSEVQRHIADLNLGRAPRLYSECVAWKGRRARIFVWARDYHGNLLSSPLCEVDGVIEGLPHLNSGGQEVDVLVRSWASRTERSFGGDDAVASLQAGFHLFDGAVGHDLSHISQGWNAGVAYTTTVRSAFLLGATVIDVDSVDGYEERFDPAKTNDERSGLITFSQGFLGPPGAPLDYRVTATGPGPTITIDPATDFAGNVGDFVANAECIYNLGGATVLTTPGTAEVVSWPSAAMQRLNAVTRSRDITDANGLWANMTLKPTFLAVRRNDEAVGVPDGGANGAPFWLSVDLDLVRGGAACAGFCFGTDLPAFIPRADGAAPQWQLPGWAFADQAASLQGRALTVVRPGNRVGFPRPRGGDNVGVNTGDGGQLPLVVPRAYWAVGERYILTDNNPAGSPTADAPVTLLAETTWGGQRVRQTMRIISAVQASSITSGAPGWALEVHPRDRVKGYPLVDLGDGERTTLRAVLAAESISPVTFMLQLLLSGSGNGFNHATYDVLPWGCNLPASAVDIKSFESAPTGEAALWNRSILLDDEESVADLLRALCQSIGYVISERVCREVGPDEGRRRLALVPLQLPIRSYAVAELSPGDVVEGQTASSETAEDLVNQIVMKTRSKLGGGLSVQTGEVRINDQDSIAEHGASEAEEIDGVGITFAVFENSQQRATLEQWAQQRFYLFGHPRRVVAAQVAYRFVATLSPGDVVWGTAGLVRSHTGLTSMAGGLIRITEISRDAELGEGEIRGEYYEGFPKGAGWAPSLRVASVDSATQVTVEANAYSDTVHPVLGTPQTDAGFFMVGDVVRCFERTAANPWPGVTRTITAISGNVITFNAAHGIAAAGGRIRVADFTSVRADLQTFAFCTAAPVQVYV